VRYFLSLLEKVAVFLGASYQGSSKTTKTFWGGKNNRQKMCTENSDVVLLLFFMTFLSVLWHGEFKNTAQKSVFYFEILQKSQHRGAFYYFIYRG
jgi:hypothetical protein